jgi:hypothetical protein
MDALAIPVFVLLDAGVLGVVLVSLMAMFAGAAIGLVIWGLVLEARSNRCWRERELAL